MDLTKQDKKHIEEQTDALVWRIKAEASEYANMYERAFLTALRDKIDARIQAKEEVEKFEKSR